MSGRLQRELKMTKPFASPEVEAFLGLIRTSDQLCRYFTAVLKPFDLTMGQYNVLRILRGAGHPGLPCGEVRARLVTWDPDITRLLDRLERRKLIQRTRSRRDRRVVHVTICHSGLELLATLEKDEQLQGADRALLGHVGVENLSRLTEILESIRIHADSLPPPMAVAAPSR
jgi:DNA-binding MarR family transcriptional regulator